MGPLPKPPANAMNGLFKKSLISVADAVSTIFLPVTVSNLSLPLNRVNQYVYSPFKNYYRWHEYVGIGRVKYVLIN